MHKKAVPVQRTRGGTPPPPVLAPHPPLLQFLLRHQPPCERLITIDARRRRRTYSFSCLNSRAYRRGCNSCPKASLTVSRAWMLSAMRYSTELVINVCNICSASCNVRNRSGRYLIGMTVANSFPGICSKSDTAPNDDRNNVRFCH